jgi:AraC-like DNA-binding protein
MPETLRGVDADRLERSCAPDRRPGRRADRPADSIRFGTGAPGLERAEVYLTTCAFEPHRHDTYALGITTAGVQTFRYRGARHVCLPGQVHVLHPDELHDGAPGTEAGFGYRILYVSPAAIREALGEAPLPFVREPVQRNARAARELALLLAELDDPVGDLERADAVAAVADLLRSLAGGRGPRPAPLDRDAVERVREHIAAHACEPIPAGTLEQVAGADRFTIARHFRRAFGTSPDRYRTLRRLAVARGAIESGEPLARAAAAAGFADQSHLTRQFKRAYGMTPARWAALTAGAGR